MKKLFNFVQIIRLITVITTSTLFRVFMNGEDEGEPLTCNTGKNKSFHLHCRTAGEYHYLLRRYCVIGVQLSV